MRMKRPQGYKHIKCPHCGEKIKVVFRTLHRLKLEVESNRLDHISQVEVEEGGLGG